MSDTNFIVLERHIRSLPRSKRKFNLYRLAVANKDVGAAEEICIAFLKHIFTTQDAVIPYHTSEAFIGAIVTAYARPFMDNDSNLKLPKSWRKFSRPELQQAHDQMLDLRGKVFAHSDAGVHPMKIYPAGYYSEKLGRQIPRTSMDLGSITVPPQSVMGFHAVCKDLRQRLEKAVFDEIDELYGGMDLPACPFPVRFEKDDGEIDEGL